MWPFSKKKKPEPKAVQAPRLIERPAQVAASSRSSSDDYNPLMDIASPFNIVSPLSPLHQAIFHDTSPSWSAPSSSCDSSSSSYDSGSSSSSDSSSCDSSSSSSSSD